MATMMTRAGRCSAMLPIVAVSFVSFMAPDLASGSAFVGKAVMRAGRSEMLST